MSTNELVEPRDFVKGISAVYITGFNVRNDSFDPAAVSIEAVRHLASLVIARLPASSELRRRSIAKVLPARVAVSLAALASRVGRLVLGRVGARAFSLAWYLWSPSVRRFGKAIT